MSICESLHRAMEQKKISFGFSKIIKKPNFLATNNKENESAKVELIKCVEGQSIQLLHQVDNLEDKPLVIPMKEGSRTSAALASLKKRQEVLNSIGDEAGDPGKDPPQEALPAGQSTNTIEEKAVLELLREATGQNGEEAPLSTLTVPVKADDLPLEGAPEPSIDDYESIPITQFGLAMLRGMGWKDEDHKKGKKSDEPILRPKGMGLGADKVLKQKALLVAPEANEKLEIKKNSFVKILGGKHRDLYGQIEGLDDHAGRVIIKLALGGARESLNEFMVQPVSKKEYAQYGKVINSVKYEEYKKMENEYGQIIVKKEDSVKTETVKDEKDWKHSRETSRHEDSYRRQKIKNEPSNDRRYNSRTSGEGNDDLQPTDSKSSSRRQHRSRSKRRSTDSSKDSDHHERHRGSKKKSKSKKSKDKERKYQDVSDEDKRHKKKTKKSKRPRSRSRERR